MCLSARFSARRAESSQEAAHEQQDSLAIGAHQIDRIAIVADRVWEDLALMFAGQGLRRVDVQFFGPSSEKQARQWLAAREARGEPTEGKHA